MATYTFRVPDNILATRPRNRVPVSIHGAGVESIQVVLSAGAKALIANDYFNLDLAIPAGEIWNIFKCRLVTDYSGVGVTLVYLSPLIQTYGAYVAVVGGVGTWDDSPLQSRFLEFGQSYSALAPVSGKFYTEWKQHAIAGQNQRMFHPFAHAGQVLRFQGQVSANATLSSFQISFDFYRMQTGKDYLESLRDGKVTDGELMRQIVSTIAMGNPNSSQMG